MTEPGLSLRMRRPAQGRLSLGGRAKRPKEQQHAQAEQEQQPTQTRRAVTGAEACRRRVKARCVQSLSCGTFSGAGEFSAMMAGGPGDGPHGGRDGAGVDQALAAPAVRTLHGFRMTVSAPASASCLRAPPAAQLPTHNTGSVLGRHAGQFGRFGRLGEQIIDGVTGAS